MMDRTWAVGTAGEARGQTPHNPSLLNFPKRFLCSLHYSGEKRLYAFSAHHPLPPNRSLKSAVTPISQVYQPFAGSPTLASSARVGDIFPPFCVVMQCNHRSVRRNDPISRRTIRAEET
jgi:hypothetical protein